MKLSYRALQKLYSSSNYAVEEENSVIKIFYYPPSYSEASGIEEDINRTIEITGKKENDYIEIIDAKIIENGKEVRKMDDSELSFWIEFIEAE